MIFLFIFIKIMILVFFLDHKNKFQMLFKYIIKISKLIILTINNI